MAYFPSYDMERIENDRSNNYFIDAREFVAVGNVFIKTLPSNDRDFYSSLV
jgi:hypothetical protein